MNPTGTGERVTPIKEKGHNVSTSWKERGKTSNCIYWNRLKEMPRCHSLIIKGTNLGAKRAKVMKYD